MSDDARNIYERIEAARPNFKAVVRNQEGQVGTRRYNYADLDVVCDAVEAALLAEGVGIFPYVHDGNVVTELRVLTNSDITSKLFIGAVVTATLPIPADLTPQQTGSAITYFRRYGLVALLNLRTEPDDDGSRASRPEQAAPVTDEPTVVLPTAPEGWESDAQSLSAHNDLRERILALPESFAESCLAFRAEHGWPLSLAEFTSLEEIVRVAEGFAPEK